MLKYKTTNVHPYLFCSSFDRPVECSSKVANDATPLCSGLAKRMNLSRLAGTVLERGREANMYIFLCKLYLIDCNGAKAHSTSTRTDLCTQNSNFKIA